MHALISLRPISSSSDVAELRKLYDKVQVHCRSMKALGTHPLTYCSMLHEIVLQSLPRDIVLRYHQRSKIKRDAADSGTTEPSLHPADKHEKKFEDLMTFFGQELECLEAVMPAFSKGSDTPRAAKQHDLRRISNAHHLPSATALHGGTNNMKKCLFCSAPHDAASCSSKEISIDQKRALLTKSGRCFRCLSPGHVSRQCKKTVVCRHCSRQHVSLMCNPDVFKSAERSRDHHTCLLTIPTTRTSGTTPNTKSKGFGKRQGRKLQNFARWRQSAKFHPKRRISETGR